MTHEGVFISSRDSFKQAATMVKEIAKTHFLLAILISLTPLIDSQGKKKRSNITVT